MPYEAGELEAMVYSRVENNTLLYTEAEVLAALTEALRVFGLFTGYDQVTVSAGNTVAGRVFYRTPPGIVIPLAVARAGRQLARCSAQAMALRWADWLRHTSASRGPVAHWIPVGLGWFALHPADAVGGAALTVTGTAEPTPITSAAQTVNVPEEFVDALVEYTGHILTLKEGGAVFADSAVLYQKFLARMKEWGQFRNLRHPRYYVEAKSPKES